MTFNINIIGVGFLGGSIANTLIKNKENFNAYDITDYDKIKCHGKFNYFRSLSNLVENSEVNDKTNIYFICVPTPSGVNGECDTSIVESVVEDLSKLINKYSIIIVKSTVSPGTTRRLNGLYSNEILDVVFCPEFLKENFANDDMYNADFSLFGTNGNEELNSTLKKLFENVIYRHKRLNFFEKVCGKAEFKTIFGKFEEMELFKYTVNTFLATKIIFFNEIHEVCEGLDLDYQKLKTLFPLEPRIGSYGIDVPGPGNDFYGFFLKCLPKEVKAMRKVQENLGLSSELMACVDKRNYYFNNKKVK
jgi:UDPglucose 6-dehydrogenase